MTALRTNIRAVAFSSSGKNGWKAGAKGIKAKTEELGNEMTATAVNGDGQYSFADEFAPQTEEEYNETAKILRYETEPKRIPSMTSAEISAWNEAKDDASARVKLSPEETKAVERYVGGDVYEWSAIQRGVPGFEMTEFFEFWIDLAQKAIAKFDPFVGRTYRNVGFRNEEKFRVFLAEHSEGADVPLSAFTSASKDPNGYVVTLPFVAHLVIDGHTGRDISESFAYPWQREVIYLPGATIHVNKVLTANDGRPLIFATEVAGNGKELRTDLRGVGQDSPRAVDEGRRGTGQGNRARSVYEGVHSDRRKEGGGSSVAVLSDLDSQYSLADDLTPEKRKAFIETFDAEFGAGATEQMFKAHDQMARALTSSLRCGRMVQEGLTCGYRFHGLSSAI